MKFPCISIEKLQEKIAHLKEGALQTQLQPHQQRIVDKIQGQRGLVVAHGLGSGKGYSSLASQDSLGMPATVVTPAGLKGNFKKEYDKHIVDGQSIEQQSLEGLARGQELKKNPLLIVDEIHKAKNPSSKVFQALKKHEAEKLLLLTGTPFYNSPENISPLVNLASGENLLPENKQDFEKKYIYNKVIQPSFLNKLKGMTPGEVQVINKHEKENLKNILNKWVDFQENSREGFPSVERQDIEVEMDPKQLAIYDTVMGDAPKMLQEKIKANMPTDKQESKNLAHYLQGPRQASLSTAPFITNQEAISPKVQKAYEELKNILGDKGKGVIFSNYIGAGIDQYKKLLDADKTIPYGEFSGRIDQATRQQMVKDYNEGKLRALLLGPSAAEGLDLKQTKLFQMLEPNWNHSRDAQAEGRAIRFQSHADLPKEKQKVLVQRFLATRPKSLLNRIGIGSPGTSVDQYLAGLSKQKGELAKQFEDLLRQEKTANLQKAEEIKKELQKKYNITPFLTGSLRLGTNLPGKYDYDFNIHLKSKDKFDLLTNKFRKIMDESKYNVDGTDRQIFTTTIKGEEVDLALTYGEKGKKYQDSVRAAEKSLTPEKRQEIIKEKERLQNAWFFKEKRYKNYKEKIDKELGILRFGRDPIKQAEHYNRNDIYGHRTSNLDSIIEHGLLSAFDAHKKGLLKSTESGNSVLSTIFNNRERSETPKELKTSIYATKGLMPVDSSYGPYGVLFRSRSMEPSKHLNFIPEEHLTKQVKGNLTFVVPDSEFEDWTKKHPEKKFLRESEIPENKKLESASYAAPIKRLLSGAKFTHESEKVAEDTKERSIFAPLISSKVVDSIGHKALVGSKNILEKPERNNLSSDLLRAMTDEGTYLQHRIKNLGKQVDLIPDNIAIGAPGAIGGFPKFKKFLENRNIEIKDPSMSRNMVRAYPNSANSTILHELGHLKNQAKFSEPVRMLGSLARGAAGSLPSLAATVYTSTQENPSNNVGLGFLGLSMPTLIGEAGASYHALKHLIKQKGAAKGLKAGANLIPAFGTYALNASMPLIGTQLNKYFNQEKTAEIRIPLRTQNSQTSCSAACLRMVLAHYGVNKSEEELAKSIGVHKRGAEGDQIEKSAREYGFNAIWKEFAPEEIMSLLEKEIPVIADVKSFNYPEANKNHWVVIEEIDLKNNKVRIADPNVKGNRRYISLAELDERWKSRNMYTGKSLTRAGVVIIKD